MEIKTNISKSDLIKLKYFFTAKQTINKMKRQPMDWEKIFSNNATNEINFQNIQTAHTNEYPKPNNLIEKLVEGLPWWSNAKTLQS